MPSTRITIGVLILMLNVLVLLSFQEDLLTYGVDPTGTLPDEIDETSAVVVPQTNCPLDSDSLSIFKERMSEVRCQDQWDISPYLKALDIMNQLKG